MAGAALVMGDTLVVRSLDRGGHHGCGVRLWCRWSRGIPLDGAAVAVWAALRRYAWGLQPAMATFVTAPYNRPLNAHLRHLFWYIVPNGKER